MMSEPDSAEHYGSSFRGGWPRRAVLLLSAAPLFAASPAWAADQADNAPTSADQGIIVYGERVDPVFAGILPEDQLNEADIAGYGADTIGDLLEILNEEFDPADGGPVVLINGRLATGINEISDLPTEAVAAIQLLPREVAGRVGQSPTRRVINITLKPDHRQATFKAEAGFATAGGGKQYEGEVNLLRIHDGDRASLVLRARAVDPLFESERNIRADGLTVPFDLIGNVVAFPTVGAPVDLGLTRAAGTPLTVAGLPLGTARPTLLQLAAIDANVSDLASVRTLISEQRAYSANGNLSRRFGDTFVSINGRADWTRSNGQAGLFGTSTRLLASSPFTPFSTDVAIVRYVGGPLRQGANSFNLDVGGNLNAPLGKWQLNAFAGFQHRVSRNINDASYDVAAYQEAVLAGLTNPFVPPNPDQLALRRNLGRFNGDSGQVRAVLTGAVAHLPAGEVRATATLAARTDRSSSRSEFLGVARNNGFKRDEAGVGVNLQLPLLANSVSALGDVTLDLNGETRTTSRVGTLTDYGAVISWLPTGSVQLRASLSREEVAPSSQSLTDPVTVIENFRIFDFLTNQTVLVRYLTGGNPDLRVASRRTLSLGVIWRPIAKRNFSLGADYTDRHGSNIQAGLPPTSAAVQAAFPDRFVRDASGRLVLVDSRPVEFSRENTQQLHWSVDFRGTVLRSGDALDAKGDPAERSFSAGRGVRANFGIDHYWMLSNERQARTGLAVVDLLAGGASGYGGGIPRHTVRLAAGASTRGLGLQMVGAWRSQSRIRVASAPSAGDLRFSSRTLADARVFADLGTLLPQVSFAKGARFAIEAKNLFDSRQRVRDSTGVTPLRYQPYLLDSLGRTIEFSLRKIF